MAAPAPRPGAEERIRAAIWFAEHDFGVFSVWSADDRGICRCPKGRTCDNAGKHPIGKQGFHENTKDPVTIRTLLSAASQPNYGLVPPEGVFALDVDGDGIQRLELLEQQMGPLPATLRTATAHGQHVFLRWPAVLPRPIGQLWGYVTRWGSGPHAGYVIGPRSVHASGAVYQPAEGSAWEIAQLPDSWAQSILTRKPAEDEPFIEVESGGYRLPDYGYTGSRYDAILSYAASRYMRGLSKDEIAAGVIHILGPRFENGLTEQELSTRFERAWHRTAERLGQPVDFATGDIAGGAVLPTLRGWPDPVEQAAYHGIVGDIVRAVADQTEADPVAILGSLLASVGACMGRWRSIYQGAAQGPNLFVVLVGDSASGRKGTAGSIARDVMTEAYPAWQSLIVAGLGSGEGLIAHLKRTEDTEHRALVMESEFGRLLTVMAREGSTLSPVVRDAWDGVPMGRFLAREQSLVTWHHVGVVAHVTPVELRDKLTNTDAANGFGNRFLWLAVRRTKLIPFPESPKGRIQPFLADLRLAITAAHTPGEVRWDEAATDRWEWLYATMSMRPRHGLLGAMLARAEAQIVRLALVYALLDKSSVINLDHLAAAEAVWRYAERSVAYVFGSSTGNRHADSLRDYLVDGPLEWEAAKKAVGVRSAADLREAVAVLSDLGLVELVAVPKAGGGRVRRAIRLLEQTLQTEHGSDTDHTDGAA